MARYLSINPLQEPFDLGTDEKGRARVRFNILCEKTESSTFEEEIVKILTDASVGTGGVDIFFSSKVSIPSGDGPYLTINSTGGPGGRKIQNQTAPAYPRPTASITTRAKNYVDARTMAWAAYDALVLVKNQTVTP